MNNSFDMGTPSVTGRPGRINPRMGVCAFLAGWIKASFVPLHPQTPTSRREINSRLPHRAPDPDLTGDPARNVTQSRAIFDGCLDLAPPGSTHPSYTPYAVITACFLRGTHHPTFARPKRSPN